MKASEARKIAKDSNSIPGMMDRIFMEIRACAKSGQINHAFNIPNDVVYDVTEELKNLGYGVILLKEHGLVQSWNVAWDVAK